MVGSGKWEVGSGEWGDFISILRTSVMNIEKRIIEEIFKKQLSVVS